VHTVVSKTFGPSTLFVCPAVVRSEESAHRVYAAVESASGIPQEEHNRWIWSWSNDLRSGVAGDSIQKILVSPVKFLLLAPLLKVQRCPVLSRGYMPQQNFQHPFLSFPQMHQSIS
jgi:hypothetical protein